MGSVKLFGHTGLCTSSVHIGDEYWNSQNSIWIAKWCLNKDNVVGWVGREINRGINHWDMPNPVDLTQTLSAL